VSLDRRPSFDHLVAPGALERRRRKPLTRTTGVGERDNARRGPLQIQYTPGSLPPEPNFPRACRARIIFVHSDDEDREAQR
jgi:hypothetical protein